MSNTYVGTFMFAGEADSLDDFAALLWAALDADPEARKAVHFSSPTILKVTDDD